MKKLFGDSSVDADQHWISVSDLMAGLMIIFLFIAITYIRPIVEKQNVIRDIVTAWETSERDIYEALKEEFRKDLPKWNAELDRKSLTIRFRAPDVLFKEGSSILKPRFEQIVGDFFPRYINVLFRFKDNIEEVRIEGHTSSGWYENATIDEAYIHNMRLSQERTRAVLGFALQLSKIESKIDWVRKHLTANGLSSSHTIQWKDGKEDPDRSRRVEFRVRTSAKDRIVQVIETIK